MAHNSYIKPGGVWPLFSLLTSGLMASIDALLYKALNADDGGTWAPAAVITIGGAGLTVTGPFTAGDANITIGSGKTLTIASGGTFVTAAGSTTTLNGDGTLSGALDVDGNITILSGGFLRVESGAALDMLGGMTVDGSVTFQTGSVVTVDAGATVISEGEFYFGDGTWPLLAPERDWERRSLNIAVTTGVTTSDPSAPDAWKVIPPGGGATTTDRIVTRPTTSGSNYTIIEFFDLPPGGTFVEAHVECIGAGPGTGGMTFPSFQVIRWQGATVDLMSALTNDTHILANWDTTPITTTIDVTSNEIIDSTYRYGVIVYHAYYSGSPAGAGFITDCVAIGRSGSMQL